MLAPECLALPLAPPDGSLRHPAEAGAGVAVAAAAHVDAAPQVGLVVGRGARSGTPAGPREDLGVVALLSDFSARDL